MNYLFNAIIGAALIYIIFKLNKMPTKAEFQQYFDTINSSVEDIKQDIETIKGTVTGAGMSEADEAEVLATLQGVSEKISALAAENPGTTEQP